MHLRDLRLHFLAAMGLSCHGKEPAHAEGRAEIVVAPVDAGPLAPPPADPPRCGPDQSPLELRADAPCPPEARYPSEGKGLCAPLSQRPALRLVSKSETECVYHACIDLAPAPPPQGIDGPGPDCCVPMPDRPSSSPAGAQRQCPAGLSGRLAFKGAEHGKCCYRSREPERHYRGRPVRVGGEARLAAPASREDWAAASGASARPGDAVTWLDAASMEHASIASFAQLSLALMAHAAPPDLLRDCHLAAIDEIEHARQSYGLASARAGRRLGPGPLDVPPLDASMSALVRDTIRDGCVGETLAAIEASEGAAQLDDGGDARAVLSQIARDELGHASLAWRIVAWAASTGHADVAPALRAARAELDRSAAARETTPAGVAEARVIREVVAPCLDALISARLAA
mgnify:CR=1 FL=1